MVWFQVTTSSQRYLLRVLVPPLSCLDILGNLATRTIRLLALRNESLSVANSMLQILSNTFEYLLNQATQSQLGPSLGLAISCP